MRPSRHLALTIVFTIASCTAPSGPAPSLAPRATEAIDPRVPVEHAMVPGSVDSSLSSRLADLVGQARSGESAFMDAVGEAERLAAAAGPPQSESWVVAQQALSVVEAARAPTTRALGDIDEIAAGELARQGGIAPANLTAIEAAAAQVGAINRRQAQAIDALQKRLGG